MGYFEQQQGLPPGSYSPEFLEIDAKAGPWLTASQKASPIGSGEFAQWDLDVNQQLIRFKNDDEVGAVAKVEILGTYNPDDGLFLWAWANPALQHLSQATAKLRDDHPDIPELTDGAHPGNEARAWALSAGAAYLLEAESCYRLTGETYTFVAIYGLTRMGEEDQPKPDPDQAATALAEYAGPMALNLGGLLIAAIQHEGQGMEEILELVNGFCNNLEELAQSPIGRDTPAAEESVQLSAVLRQGMICLSLPPNHPQLIEGVKEMLALLKDVATRYGAWEQQEEAFARDDEERGGSAS